MSDALRFQAGGEEGACGVRVRGLGGVCARASVKFQRIRRQAGIKDSM